MAFIVEDGSGLSNSNSFATVQQFKDYCTDRGYPSATWLDARIQVGLVKATSFIATYYRERFKGVKNTYTQALPWPRFNACIDGTGEGIFIEGYGTTQNGYVIPNNVVPAELANAAIELAIIADTTVLAPNLKVGDGFVKSKKIGPIEFQYEKGYAAWPIWRWVDMLLTPLLESSGINVQIRRS